MMLTKASVCIWTLSNNDYVERAPILSTCKQRNYILRLQLLSHKSNERWR